MREVHQVPQLPQQQPYQLWYLQVLEQGLGLGLGLGLVLVLGRVRVRVRVRVRAVQWTL
jgi:hypothetical protein